MRLNIMVIPQSQESMDWAEGDPLDLHIRQKGLGLVRRRPTVTDGNCWYDAVADQVILTSFPLLIY